MKVRALLSFLAFSALLTGCGDAPPVVLNDAQSGYFGSWEHVSTEYGNNIVSDNMLLIFHPDSRVSYKRCINRMNGHRYTSLPDATIKSLTDKQLVISVGIWKIRWNEELPIDRPPYAEGDDRYLNVDGQKLRKLRDGESSTHESWKCDSDDDKGKDQDDSV